MIEKKYTRKTKKVHVKDTPTYIDELIFQNNMLAWFLVSSYYILQNDANSLSHHNMFQRD